MEGGSGGMSAKNYIRVKLVTSIMEVIFPFGGTVVSYSMLQECISI